MFLYGALLWVIAPTEDRALRRSAAPTEDAGRGQLLLSNPDALTSANLSSTFDLELALDERAGRWSARAL